MSYNTMGHMGSIANLSVLMALYKAGDTRNTGLVNDPKYEELYTQFNNAKNLDEIKQIIRNADKLAIEQHWSIGAFPYNSYNVSQPYLKGLAGEMNGGSSVFFNAFYWKWAWIEQAAKKALGR